MQQDVLMVKGAQQKATCHTVPKYDISSRGADALNPFENNGYLVALADGQEMVTADNYSGAQRLQLKPAQGLQEIGPLKEKCLIAGRPLVEDCNENESRHSPVLLEGKVVDLLQLCTEVLAHGGYEKVTDVSMWSSIGESIGFGQNCGATLKLVYAKYLKNLETNKELLKNGENVDGGFAKNVEESSTGMAECDVIGSGSSISPDSSICYQEIGGEIPSKRRKLSYSREDHALHSSLPDHVLPVSTGSDSLVGMVEWVRRLALNPGDPRKGQGPRGSKQNEAWVEDCCAMVVKARSVLWGRKELFHYGSLSGNTVKQRIPPNVYYKELSKPNTRTLEKLRANQTRAMKCGLHLSGDAIEVQAVRPSWLCQTPSQTTALGSGQFIDTGLDLSSDYVKSMSEALSIGYLLNNKASRKRIPIGPHFQAQIPPWTGRVLEEDTQGFGGACVWPLPDPESKAFDISRVGMGRALRCSCVFPMSIECVKLHIAEDRAKLSKEVGDAFNSWGFYDMGESVSCRWTKREEALFDSTVKSNPLSLGKNFWDELPAALPLKTRRELVSYYFNVFVVRRRAIENRTMPDSIDSDDDERELSSTGTSSAFGRKMRMQYEDLVGNVPNFLALRREASANTATNFTPCPLEKF